MLNVQTFSNVSTNSNVFKRFNEFKRLKAALESFLGYTYNTELFKNKYSLLAIEM